MLTRRTLLVGGSIAAAALAARQLRPTLHESAHVPPLDTLVPKQIGPWRLVPDPRIQVSLSTGDTTRDQPYDDQISRTYTDGQGHEIMLAVAYGARQRQEVKIHRPELCYPAQGWRVLDLQPAQFDVRPGGAPAITGHRMLVTNDTYDEAVSYWIRIGSTYSDSAWRTRWVIIQEGLAGRMTDGVLVRFSERLQRGTPAQVSYERQAAFARLLIQNTPPEFRGLLAR